MERSYDLTVDGWFSCGWHTFKSRNRQLFSGVMVLFAYSLALLFLGSLPGGSVIGIGVQLTLGLVLAAGWMNFCLRLVRGEDASPAVIFSPFSRFWQVWSLAALLSVLIAAGLLLFVVPGLYWLLKFGLSMFAVVDRETSPQESMRLSERLTRGHKGKMLVFYGITMGLYGLSVFPFAMQRGMLGAISISIYSFVLTPFLGVTYASAYDSLLSCRREIAEG
ncbi:MAG: hypothetical protein JXB45_01175 [Candidatus Krumholzibacteriota bacterium]|nr:hypothetical protein [Candidatus Krumholzibacteriota bacterium]